MRRWGESVACAHGSFKRTRTTVGAQQQQRSTHITILLSGRTTASGRVSLVQHEHRNARVFLRIVRSQWRRSLCTSISRVCFVSSSTRSRLSRRVESAWSYTRATHSVESVLCIYECVSVCECVCVHMWLRKYARYDRQQQGTSATVCMTKRAALHNYHTESAKFRRNTSDGCLTTCRDQHRHRILLDYQQPHRIYHTL